MGAILRFYFAVVFFLISAAIGLWVATSCMEAHAFEEVTGKRVTTWQAMWIDLRVMEPAKDR